MLRIRIFTLLVFTSLFCFAGTTARAEEIVRHIVFPTDRAVTFQDDFEDPRFGHLHEGTDLMGEKMMPLYAAVSGWVRGVEIPEASWGYAITLGDADGYTYHYLHVNNDTPGTEDGAGGTEYAYAPGIRRGVAVTAGQLIGWMGDSGNAENVGAHLHFEIRTLDGTAIDPYPSLLAAGAPSVNFKAEIATASSPDINTDKGLVAGADPAPCASGVLVKSSSSTAVYYCGANGKRYVFPNDRVYFSWYVDFKNVVTISAADLAAIPLGGNATYRPGVKMVKIESVPNVYVVDHGGVLRWVRTSAAAAALYGEDWAKQVDDISDAFFGNYQFGEDVDVGLPS